MKDILLEPKKENKIFETQKVNTKNVVNGEMSWDRSRDTEFKILNEVATKLGQDTKVNGKIKLYTDLDCCPSCRNVIEQFKKRYPDIKIEIIYKK